MCLLLSLGSSQFSKYLLRSMVGAVPQSCREHTRRGVVTAISIIIIIVLLTGHLSCYQTLLFTLHTLLI